MEKVIKFFVNHGANVSVDSTEEGLDISVSLFNFKHAMHIKIGFCTLERLIKFFTKIGAKIKVWKGEIDVDKQS